MKTNKPLSEQDTTQGNITSGSHQTCWTASVAPIRYQPLQQDETSDVVIVGGGIAGMSIAYQLVRAGKRVIVLDDGFVGSGETGRTTAHVVNALDDRYAEIERILGEEKCRLAAESHTRAIDVIEGIVTDEKINCGFQRVEGYLFLHPSDKNSTLEDEYTATNKFGIRTEKSMGVPGIPSEQGMCLHFPRQAQFHPLQYLRGLADAIVRRGGRIFTESRVSKVTRTGVESGPHTVRAEHVVVATNSPINNFVTMHTKQFAYRSYVIGARVPKGSLPTALWWDTGNLDSAWVREPYHYVRIQPLDDGYDLLIAGGEDHKTGQADKEEIAVEARYERLEAWCRKRFPMMQDVVYRWSGQVMEPVDRLAFIGRNPGDKNIYIATGDSGNGITHGTIAGLLISDLILEKENAWEKLYNPSRITIKATPDFLKEAGNMGIQYLDFLDPDDVQSVRELGAGQGAIVKMKGRKTAVYKDGAHVLHAYSALCPHMGCVVQWNSDEKSFDCPCHGSRFTCEGKVVNGPALSDMKRVDFRDAQGVAPDAGV